MSRGRRARRTVVVALALVTIAAAPARAAWTPAAAITTGKDVRETTVAVDARGDAAVAWAVDPSFLGRTGALQVRVAYRRGWSGAFTTHTVMHGSGLTARGLTVALDRRGELSVAWIDQYVTKGLLHGRKTIRGAFRTPSGRWSAVQAIGSASPFAYAFTTLAVAPSGRVLLTYNARVSAAPGMAAVWRMPGHSFGAVHALPTGKGGLLQEPTTVFDSAGRAYVAGILDCDRATSRGVLLTAPPGSSRFAAMRTVAPSPAHHLRLVVTGAGRGALTFRHVGCSTTEDLSGPLEGARIAGAKADAPVVIDPQSTAQAWLSGAPANGAEAGWTAFPVNGPETVILSSRMSDAGAWATPSAAPGGWTAIVADAAGNQVVQTLRPLTYGLADTAGARSTTGTVDPAPLSKSPFPAAGATDGAGLIIAATGTTKVTVSTWRP